MGEFSALLRQRVLSWLANNLPESRIEHVLRVEQMAVALACLQNSNTSQAAQAGLMHDLAKYFKPQVFLQTEAALPLDRVDELSPHLLQTSISAIRTSAMLVWQMFNVCEPVLAVIANHGLGSGMSDLSYVAFFAKGYVAIVQSHDIELLRIANVL